MYASAITVIERRFRQRNRSCLAVVGAGGAAATASAIGGDAALALTFAVPALLALALAGVVHLRRCADYRHYVLSLFDQEMRSQLRRLADQLVPDVERPVPGVGTGPAAHPG